jgi:hypothetical protein
MSKQEQENRVFSPEDEGNNGIINRSLGIRHMPIPRAEKRPQPTLQEQYESHMDSGDHLLREASTIERYLGLDAAGDLYEQANTSYHNAIANTVEGDENFADYLKRAQTSIKLASWSGLKEYEHFDRRADLLDAAKKDLAYSWALIHASEGVEPENIRAVDELPEEVLTTIAAAVSIEAGIAFAEGRPTRALEIVALGEEELGTSSLTIHNGLDGEVRSLVDYIQSKKSHPQPPSTSATEFLLATAA